MSNYIYEYYQQIKEGHVIVGRWVALLYEIIVKGIETRKWFYDAKKADRAIKYITTFVHHHEGALAPQLLKLELWQKALISVIFGIVDETGQRNFREVFCIIGRKNGKTLLASAVSSYCAFADDEYGAQVVFCAPKLEQAGLCYNACWQSITKEPALYELTKRRRTDVYIQSTNSTIKPIAFSAKKSDGFNISCGICDEVAGWAGDAGLKFYEVLKSSQGARRAPLLMSISTASYINGGVYDELFTRATRWLLGDSGERRFLPVLYMIDDPTKWADINELHKANPNLGVSITVDYLLEEIAIANGSLSKRGEFLTKYCNVKQNSSTAFLSAESVKRAQIAPLSLDMFSNCYAVAGVDLSQTVDLTSACVCIEKDGIINVVSHFWIPSEKVEEATARDGIPYKLYEQAGYISFSGENVVDYHDVYNWFTDLITKYKIYVLKVGYDRYSAQYLVNDLKTFGFHCDDVYQGYNLTPVIQDFEGNFKDGRVNIGNNPLLQIHLLNSALKVDAESARRKLVKITAQDHIDGAAALLDAFTVRQKYYSEIGGQLANIQRG